MSSPGGALPLAVSIVVLTFRRNEDLAALLPALQVQARSVAPAEVEVVVVDNDPDAGAADLVRGFDLRGIRYVHEPAPGITHARNRALDETSACDLLVFIDDDELPWDGWLSAMLETQAATGAAGVAGLVVPRYAGEPDPFVLAGGFFVRQDRADRSEMPAAGSGNLLLDMHQVRPLGLRFDDRFGLTGGSDHLFTRDLIRRGGRIVWSAGAGVVDSVPASRSTRTWVMQRQFRVGNTWSRVGIVLCDGPLERLLARFVLTARGLARVGFGGARRCLGLASGSLSHEARGAKTYRRGLGMISGAWGGTFVEYRRATR